MPTSPPRSPPEGTTATGSITFRPHFAASSYHGVTVDIPDSGSASAEPEPEITEDPEDWAQMRADIAANGGQPSNSAESQYLWICEQGGLPAADCPSGPGRHRVLPPLFTPGGHPEPDQRLCGSTHATAVVSEHRRCQSPPGSTRSAVTPM